MERRPLQSAALIAVAILAGACDPGKTGAGCNPQARKERSDDLRTDPAPSTTVDEGADEESMQRVVAVQRTAENADITPPDVRPQPERPWAHNTGPNDPEALTPSGTLTITTDGAVLENLDISGMLTIDADNVTVRNFRIEASAYYGIRVADGHSGIVLEDGEIYGMKSAGILGVGYSARRLHIHDSDGDGLKAQGTGGPTVVEYCFIEKMGRGLEAHADGNQTRGGSNITFRYNNIYMPYPGTPNYPGAPYKSNAAFMSSGKISNFVIERNWLTGGNYTIYCSNSGVSVRNNIFGRENGGLSKGKEARRLRSGSCVEWSGNRWEDTGEPN